MPRLIDGTCRWQRLSSRKLSSLKRETPGMKIDGYSGAYFVVNNVEVRSSIVLLPHTGYLWRPQTFAEVTPNAFTLFRLLRPKLGTVASVFGLFGFLTSVSLYADVLIVGGGRSTPVSSCESFVSMSHVMFSYSI